MTEAPRIAVAIEQPCGSELVETPPSSPRGAQDRRQVRRMENGVAPTGSDKGRKHEEADRAVVDLSEPPENLRPQRYHRVSHDGGQPGRVDVRTYAHVNRDARHPANIARASDAAAPGRRGATARR